MRRTDSTIIAIALLSTATLVAIITIVAFPANTPVDKANLPVPSFSPANSPVSQAIDGITVTIWPLYADPSSIILTFTVSGPDQAYPYNIEYSSEPPNQHLVLSNGIELPANPDSQLYVWTYRGSRLYPPYQREGYLNFNTSYFTNLPPTLTMRLTLPIFVNNHPYIVPLPEPTQPPGAYPALTATPTRTAIAPNDRAILFTFDLVIPFDPVCKEVAINQTATVADVEMTLTNVTLAATEFRFNIILTSTIPLDDFYNPARDVWGLDANLKINADTTVKLGASCNHGICPGVLKRPLALLDTSQQWVLTVDRLGNSYGSSTRSPKVEGPWQFLIDMSAPSVCAQIPTPTGTKSP